MISYVIGCNFFTFQPKKIIYISNFDISSELESQENVWEIILFIKYAYFIVSSSLL